MFITCMNTGRVFCQASFRPLGGSGSFRKASSLPTSRSAVDRVFSHPQRDALRRAEQVAEHRNRVSLRFLEQQRRTAGPQHAVANFGHLEARIDLDADALELALEFELGEEIAQVGVLHEGGWLS